MRALIPVLCLLICGCNSKVAKQTVVDSAGANRLVLNDRRVWSLTDAIRNEQGYDFDSLVWQTNAAGKWADRVTISEKSFQGSSSRTRWVSQIHSLNPTNGTAIIKVAEGDVSAGSGTIQYIYSWREWSLLTNGEARFVRRCSQPFEPY
jgi:hypothetical protein